MTLISLEDSFKAIYFNETDEHEKSWNATNQMKKFDGGWFEQTFRNNCRHLSKIISLVRIITIVREYFAYIHFAFKQNYHQHI